MAAHNPFYDLSKADEMGSMLLTDKTTVHSMQHTYITHTQHPAHLWLIILQQILNSTLMDVNWYSMIVPNMHSLDRNYTYCYHQKQG